MLLTSVVPLRRGPTIKIRESGGTFADQQQDMNDWIMLALMEPVKLATGLIQKQAARSKTVIGGKVGARRGRRAWASATRQFARLLPPAADRARSGWPPTIRR